MCIKGRNTCNALLLWCITQEEISMERTRWMALMQPKKKEVVKEPDRVRGLGLFLVFRLLI
jgi:hypothetical protein